MIGTKGAVPCEEGGGKQEPSWISETGTKVGRQSQNPKINKSSHWLSDSYGDVSNMTVIQGSSTPNLSVCFGLEALRSFLKLTTNY